ncbi:MAG TPA: alcohol dehydrogenase catalytic domain-containing protein [Longimicrobiales bacterium]
MKVPERMRVARLYGWGDVRVEEASVPVPGPGEVLVRVAACGVCGSDALVWYVERKAPAVLGHEPVGEVVAVGEGVRQFRLGDRVFAHHHAPCMACEECRRGLWSNCETWKRPQLEPGGFAEYALVRAESVARDTLVLPDVLDWEAGVFIEPLATCVRALRRQGRVAPGDAVLVVGLGVMGQLLVSLARAYGAGVVVGSDFVAERRERALRRGADVVVDPAGGGAAAAVRAATAGRGADVVVVCPGDGAAVRAGLEAAAPGGRVVCFTPLAPGAPVEMDLSALYFREVALLQSYSCGPDETREALELLVAGAVEVATLVTHRAGLDGVAAALERAAGKAAGMKTVILPGA